MALARVLKVDNATGRARDMRTIQKKFEKLVKEHEKASEARQEAAAHRASIKGLGGPLGELEALSSTVGTEAVETELALLRAERKALKKLHAFAFKVSGRAEDGHS